nr:MAG TPA: hypothetical protein [Caudoviricetes sp.]
MNKYDLWEKGSRSRYFHATTHANAESNMDDIPTAKVVKISRYSTKEDQTE